MTTTDIFIPGKAYDILVGAAFMSGRINDEAQRKTRVALKDGERRNKGRGFRVLVSLDGDSSQYLCDHLGSFINGSDYSKLSTAESLAIRTITDRICEIANVCATAREKRQAGVERRVEAMRAGKERAAAEKATQDAVEAREALADIEAKLPTWVQDYNDTMDQIIKLGDKKPEKVQGLFNKADSLQNTIIRSRDRIRNLNRKVNA